jgi:hypothetical protein
MPFNTELTRALGIKGWLYFNIDQRKTDIEQYPSFKEVCNGWDTPSLPVPSATQEVLV